MAGILKKGLEKIAPFKSEAQRRYFHWAQKEGKIPKKTVDEWEAATPEGKKLPERVKKAAANYQKTPAPRATPSTPKAEAPSENKVKAPPMKKGASDFIRDCVTEGFYERLIEKDAQMAMGAASGMGGGMNTPTPPAGGAVKSQASAGRGMMGARPAPLATKPIDPNQTGPKGMGVQGAP